MPKLTASTRADRRRRIIAAAITCFARAGYHATTMADIATEAEVAKGTPYLYFPSKEELFAALYQEWDCAMGAHIDRAVQALPEHHRHAPRPVLHTLVTAIGEHVTTEPTTCRVLMEASTLAASVPAIAEVVNASDARTHDQLTNLFRALAAAEQTPTRADPALSARLFTATLYGLMARWHLAPGSFSWNDIADALAGT